MRRKAEKEVTPRNEEKLYRLHRNHPQHPQGLLASGGPAGFKKMLH
jgi:hypothetical protein